MYVLVHNSIKSVVQKRLCGVHLLLFYLKDIKVKSNHNLCTYKNEMSYFYYMKIINFPNTVHGIAQTMNRFHNESER